MSSCFSHVLFFATLWTVVYQAPLSMGFSKQEYWSGLPFPSPEDLPDPGIEPWSPTLQAEWCALYQNLSFCSIRKCVCVLLNMGTSLVAQ